MSDQNHTTPVEYRTIERHVGYRFGFDGSVQTLWVRGQTQLRLDGTWRPKKPTMNRVTGYYFVLLKKPEGKGLVCRTVHRLILEAFTGAPATGMQCRHIDGNKQNNRRDNLCWGTNVENGNDRIRHDTAGVKLKNADVLAIRAAIAAGIRSKSIAHDYGINPATVQKIARRKIWKRL